jgi:hypothetical protein
LLVNYAFCELLEINNSFLVGAAALVSIVKSLASGFFFQFLIYFLTQNLISCFCFLLMKLSNFRLCRSTSAEVGVRASMFTIMVTLVICLYLTGTILFCLICLHIGKILEVLKTGQKRLLKLLL